MIRNAWIWCQGGVFWLSDTNNHLPIIQRTSGCVLCSFPCKQSLRYVTYNGKLSWAFINKTITYSSLDFKMLERSANIEDLKQSNTKKPFKYKDQALRSLASVLTTKSNDKYFRLSGNRDIMRLRIDFECLFVYLCLWIARHPSC